MGKTFDQAGWLSGNVHTDGTTPTAPPTGGVGPSANFSFIISTLTVTFTDTSVAGDVAISNWRWTFGDGPTSVTSQGPVGHTYVAGTYQASLTVTDINGLSDTATQSVTVGGTGNQPPVSDFTVSINNTTLVATVTNTSTDSDGTIVSYLWGWGDGTTSTGSSPSPHTYPRAGIYTISLSVTDNGGATTIRNRSKKVGTPPTGYSFRTMLGTYGSPTSAWGSAGVWPDSEIQNAGTNPGDAFLHATTGYIDKARNASGSLTPASCLIAKVAAGNANLKDGNNRFSLPLWKAYIDTFYGGVHGVTFGGTDGEVKLQAAVKDGVIRFLYLLDDFGSSSGAGTPGSNAFSAPVLFEEIEYMAYYVKVVKGWNWMPCTARTRSTLFKSAAAKAVISNSTSSGTYSPNYSICSFLSADSTRNTNGVRQYQYMDAAWNQIRIDRDGPSIDTYINSEWPAAAACNLAVIGGGNLINGGDAVKNSDGTYSHGDTAWGARRSGESDSAYLFRMHPGYPGNGDTPPLRLFGMSPTEIKNVVQKMMNRSETNAFTFWEDHAYVALTDITAAFTTALSYGTDRTDGPPSIGGKLTILS